MAMDQPALRVRKNRHPDRISSSQKWLVAVPLAFCLIEPPTIAAWQSRGWAPTPLEPAAGLSVSPRAAGERADRGDLGLAGSAHVKRARSGRTALGWGPSAGRKSSCGGRVFPRDVRGSRDRHAHSLLA